MFESFEHSYFEFVSYFEIRYSYLNTGAIKYAPSRGEAKPGPLGSDLYGIDRAIEITMNFLDKTSG